MVCFTFICFVRFLFPSCFPLDEKRQKENNLEESSEKKCPSKRIFPSLLYIYLSPVKGLLPARNLVSIVAVFSLLVKT